jgi:hypothetical protein
VLAESDETLLYDLMRTAQEGAGLTVGEYLGRLLRGRAAQRVADRCGRSAANSAREQDPNPVQEPNAEDSDAALPTLPQLATALRFVLVIHEDRATGQRIMRTRHGLREVPPDLLAEGRQLGETVDLAELREQALISAARSKGREIPPLVLRYVQLRSQGRCEAPACHARAESTHHDERRAWKVDHHPDRLEARCRDHHSQDHLLGAERGGTPQAEIDAAYRRIRVEVLRG